MSCLSGRDATKVDRFIAEVSSIWSHEDFMARLAERLCVAVGAGASIVYELTPEGCRGKVGHTLGADERARTSWSTVPGHEHIPGLARYRFRLGEPADPFANRSVRERELYCGDGAGLAALREKILRPCGIGYQLRVALYGEHRFLGLAAVFTTPGERDFSDRHQAILQAVTPALLDGLVALRAVSAVPRPRIEVGALLDAFDRPAYLVTDRGSVVFRNAAARSSPVPEWLASSVRSAQARHVHPKGHAHRLELESRGIWLVISRDSAIRGCLDLPPSLAAVAELMLEGLSDKEIADALDRDLRTVRTYVHRIYARTGAHSRVQLLLRAKGHR